MGEDIMRNHTSYYKKFARTLADRDGGLFCHYCGHELVPPGIADGDARYFESPITLNIDFGSHVYTRVYHFYLPQYRQGTVDHIVSVKDGGTLDLYNLVLACKRCNSQKRNHPYHEFKRMKGMAS